ncbi:secondary thiamine-phosphate synthase enzyme YjbQ [Nitratidesulfovibrio sp. SRB-5]|uniref:secondary thiamine-phosphate synthase enzyme YjbQ n=1 Tax=Nitratidesulfovibrio sp. SRB-5 TaxID=2872636 RepID=UPI001026F4A7|nr:secondary thiamine-phosphate synthase enzyme YjbQ [Nitratidesulfovibrio sp. SRB-5]MBZ2170678.1 secondary thiamine-phosphate synthase enzyme YjbQ [Nitratidesulfovibrio sp. SRB-5]RXF75949.1 YjbQ family protein [Desulfovibrio sp. DS-1]
METLSLRTTAREQLLDVTEELQELVARKGWTEGALVLFCPHTTGAVTVNEAADPDVARDIAVNMGTIVPRRGDYRHAEGNSDAHIKTSLFGPSMLLIVDGGRLRLGTWQGVYFCEFDGPRERRLWVQWLPG